MEEEFITHTLVRFTMPGSGFNNRSTIRPNQQAKKRIPFKAKNEHWQKGWGKNNQTPATTAKPETESKANRASKS